jgi:hypothetical protein
MGRNDEQVGTERTIERLAHAFSPAEWSGRSLFLGSVVFAFVAVVTVVQRALVATGVVGWTITAIHVVLVVVVVPVLVRRTVRQWRSVQASIEVPE